MTLLSGPPDQRPELTIPRRRRGFGAVHPGPVLVVGALMAAPLVVDGIWTFTLAFGVTIGISCLGLLVLSGWCRQISLMHAGVTGCAVYLTWSTGDRLYDGRERGYVWRPVVLDDGAVSRISEFHVDGWAYLFCPAVGIVFAVVAYLLVGLVAQRLAWPYLLVLTFGTQALIENYVFQNSRYVGHLTDWSFVRPQVFGVSFGSDTRFFYVVLAIALVTVLVLHRLRHSRFGRALILAGQAPELAAAVGVSPWRYRVAAAVIAGACAGVGGSLQALLFVNAPGHLQYDFNHSVVYLAVALLAGCASLLAVLAVAVAFAVLPLLGYETEWLPDFNLYLLAGVGMALGVLLGPRGLGGAVVDLFVRPRGPRIEPELGAAVEYDAVEVPFDEPLR